MIIWNIDKSGLLSHQALWTNKWTTDRPWLDSSCLRNELRSMRATQSGKHDCVFRLKASLVHVSFILFIYIFKDHNVKPGVGSKSTNTYCTEVDFCSICSFPDNFFLLFLPTFEHKHLSIIEYSLICVIVRRLRNIKTNIFSFILCSGRFLAARLIFFFFFVVCLGTTGTNPTDSTFKFNSLWITLIWREFQFDQKWLVEMSFRGKRRTKEVKSVLLLSQESIFTQVCVLLLE